MKRVDAHGWGVDWQRLEYSHAGHYRLWRHGCLHAILEVPWTLIEVGRCLREAGRLEEAKSFLERVLQIQEAKLGVQP